MVMACPKCGSARIQSRGVRKDHKNGAHRFSCYECRHNFTYHTAAPDATKPPKPPAIDPKNVAGIEKFLNKRGAKRLVITSAQNATPIHEPFFKALLGYCEHNDAQLVVIPFRYRNPTAMRAKGDSDDEWWAPGLAPYLFDRRVRLNENLELLADIKTQPTASRPLSGFETITGDRSGIVGHPKLELDTIPTPAHRLPKILTTTGAVTRPQYLDSKAGKKGEFHHTFGAVVVEVVNAKAFHMRQINATNDGSFCDLDFEYLPDGGTNSSAVKAIVLGDWHDEFHDPAVARAVFGSDGMVDALNPDYVVWHDLNDFYSRNHHHRFDPIIAYRKRQRGREVESVHMTLCSTAARLRNYAAAYPRVSHIVVPSNHPDALARWVKETDPRLDPINLPFWCETAKAMAEGSTWGKTGVQQIDPFAWWMRKWLPQGRFNFLARDESFQIERIEIGYHGDKGPNGARGSRAGFGKIGAKSIIGHSHSPGVRDGVYQVGTSSHLRLEYNSGPSSWLQTHCLIYRNGKRSLINVIDGNWRA